MNDGAVQPSSTPQSTASVKLAGAKKFSLAALAIAGLGAVVMIDLVVETFSAGSSLRWWALAAAAAFVSVTVAARRKNIGWRAQLTILLVFALGLAAATVWRPAGLTDGIRFAGQPTSRVLAGLTAAALIVAMVTILRATILPLAVRLVLSLLPLYGLAAFMLGAWHRTPYAALYAGDSVWHVLSRWLQGAILGGLVALPLALLLALVQGLARGKRSWSPQAMIVLLLTAAVAFAAFRSGRGAIPSGVTIDPSAARVSVPNQARFAHAPPDQRSFTDADWLIQRIADTPEPSRFSAEKIADQLGNDPAALFAWVHDHVRTEIYSGLLRGARGTLISGAGNAWDQALLLATMLRHQGREVRFARVHLTPEISAKIVDRMFSDAGRPQVPSGKPLQIPASLQNGSRATLAQIQSDWQRAQADLLQALDRANLSLGDAATSEQALESEAADHLFVEYHNGDQWIALDPVATAAPGASVPSAAEHASDVPDSFYHHVTIRVLIEERHGQSLQEQEVLRFRTTAAALSGAQVLLSHRLNNDLTGGWRATPVLQIDGQAYAARTFSDAGLVAGKANSKEDLIAQAHNAVSHLDQVTALFGDDKAPSSGQPAAQAGFSAEWLDIEFTDPANHSLTVRRELIDRIGPVARANKTAATAPLSSINVVNGIPLPLAGIYALAFATGTVDPALPASRLRSAKGLIEDLQALRDARPAQNRSLSTEDQDRLVRVLGRYPAFLQASAESTLGLSQRLARSHPMGGSSVVFYEATPRLVIASFNLTSGLALDLRRNTVRAVAGKSPASEIVRASLARSVGDAAIEGDVLTLSAHARRITAIDIFDRARAQGIPLVALHSGAPLSTLQASDLARARMANAEAATVLIAPERTPSGGPAHFAWWKLDPATGETITILDTGLNGFQDLPEEAILETNVISPLAQTMSGPYNAVSPLATTLSNGALSSSEISPLANTLSELGPQQLAGQGNPWALCGEFTGDMMMELLRALTAAGEDTSQFFL
jgi:Transglutaminase-like superfamily